MALLLPYGRGGGGGGGGAVWRLEDLEEDLCKLFGKFLEVLSQKHLCSFLVNLYLIAESRLTADCTYWRSSKSGYCACFKRRDERCVEGTSQIKQFANIWKLFVYFALNLVPLKALKHRGQVFPLDTKESVGDILMEPQGGGRGENRRKVVRERFILKLVTGSVKRRADSR